MALGGVAAGGPPGGRLAGGAALSGRDGNLRLGGVAAGRRPPGPRGGAGVGFSWTVI